MEGPPPPEDEVSSESLAEQIFQLLAELVERGAEWDPLTRSSLRQALTQLLLQVGAQSFDDPKLIDIIANAQRKDVNIPEPANYPSYEEFAASYNNPQGERAKATSFEPGEILSLSQALPLARTNATNWQQVTGRGAQGITEKGTIQYLYEMGKLMAHQDAYKFVFEDDDIRINGATGKVENGRHRVLAAMCLGQEYITQSRMEQ